LPYVAVFDLSVLNELSGPNFKSWMFIEGIMEGSMRGLFSMLFGAGMILFISRLEKKNAGTIKTRTLMAQIIKIYYDSNKADHNNLKRSAFQFAKR
jgi:uncharacterized membrane protein YeiB